MDGAGAAPLDDQAQQHRRLVRRVLEQLVLEGGFEVAEARNGRVAGLADLRPAVADRDAEILGDAFRDLAGDIQFLRRRDIAGLRPGDGRQRHLVRDARVVGRQRSGKESRADKTMGGRLRDGQQSQQECGRKQAAKIAGHDASPLARERHWAAAERAALRHAPSGGPRGLGYRMRQAAGQGRSAGRRECGSDCKVNTLEQGRRRRERCLMRSGEAENAVRARGNSGIASGQRPARLEHRAGTARTSEFRDRRAPGSPGRTRSTASARQRRRPQPCQ